MKNHVEEAWVALETALAKFIPQVFEHLTPGASDTDLAYLEGALGFPLSQEFRQFYQRHNGHREIEDISYSFDARTPTYAKDQDEYIYTDYFLFSLIFMPAFSTETKEPDVWNASITDLVLSGGPASIKDHEVLEFWGPVKPLGWNKRWVPIAASPEEDYVCVDFDPAAGGKLGQVIFCRYSESRIEVVADSLHQFLQLQAEDLLTGLTVAESAP